MSKLESLRYSARLHEAVTTTSLGFSQIEGRLSTRGWSFGQFFAVWEAQQRTLTFLTLAWLKNLLRICRDCSWAGRITPLLTAFDPLALVLDGMDIVGVLLLLSFQGNTHNRCTTSSRSLRYNSLEDDRKDYYLPVALQCPRPDASHAPFILEAVHWLHLGSILQQPGLQLGCRARHHQLV
jgi:hypothetical protein